MTSSRDTRGPRPPGPGQNPPPAASPGSDDAGQPAHVPAARTFRAEDRGAAVAAEPVPLGQSDLGTPATNGSDVHLLEACRTHWLYGEWDRLAAVNVGSLEDHPHRAKLALLVAAAKSHLGDRLAARDLVSCAVAWGCDRRLVARVMASMVHNSLGRMAAGLDTPAVATRHFESALALIEPHGAPTLLARTRQVRETSRMGLLPDAAKLLGDDLEAAHVGPLDLDARLASLRTELDLLGHELSLSLKRGQLMSGDRVGAAASDLASRSVSQLGQDLWVLEQTGYKRDGFFVEFGATDGVRLSNSWLLEAEFGWRGICAEPNPDLFARLQANRRCVTSPACIGGRSGEEVEFILADAFGGITAFAQLDLHAERREAFRRDGRVMRMVTVSLEDFLIAHDAPQEIDYLSIDTEGSEYEILRHFPFDRWRIRLITVEHNNTPQRELIHRLLEPLGYRRREMQFDDWYALDTAR